MFGVSTDTAIQNEIANLKYTCKTLMRNAQMQKKREAEYYKKAKRSMTTGDERTAATYIKQSVQFASLALRSTEMACNLEVVEAKINESIQSGSMNKSITNTLSLLISKLRPTNAINNMGNIDKSFEDIMTYSNAMTNVLDGVAAPNVGSNELESNLLAGLKEEVSNEASYALPACPIAPKTATKMKNNNYF
jgi:hypothetical protein